MNCPGVVTVISRTHKVVSDFLACVVGVLEKLNESWNANIPLFDREFYGNLSPFYL